VPDPQPRHLRTAELLSIGSELTVGETVDTNAGETARALTELGVRVLRLSGLPDELEIVAEAVRIALDRADLVVTTGGLGPTPDDLTREAIAAVCGETPAVDPELERWLRALFARRGLAFPATNLKQAWTIPSATPLPNANGTAPGWWVDRPEGRVVVALPGPPREMRAMWAESVIPRLRARGLGVATAVRTFRLAGIGESLVAERLGEALLRAANPSVATYARVEAVDVRIATVGAEDGSATAAELLETTAERVLRAIGDHVWAEGDTTWAQAIEAELGARAWRWPSAGRPVRSWA
jgi:nicotinamide-nucleotide amidase